MVRFYALRNNLRSHVSSVNLTNVFSQSLTRVLELVTNAVEWPIHSIDIPDTWASQSGKLVITGDAAHAMTPYMALGAAMAVEDAASMAEVLRNLSSMNDLAEVLDKWKAVRQPRVTQVQEASWCHGLILHFPDGPLQKARDQALEAELGPNPFTESPNQWSDPKTTQWAYDYNPVQAINNY